MATTHSERAWAFWRRFGERPLCLAPMAEVNDLAFRVQCRRHGLSVCYTGMINAIQWCQGARYQSRVFNTAPCDRPLIVQLAGANHDALVAAARDIAPHCDAIDLNLGCTQRIAKRGEYGFFMADTAEKRASVAALIARLAAAVPVPITAKIRVLAAADGSPDAAATAAFARQLQDAGASVVAVHGRFEMRNKRADVATAAIRSVVEALDIPVVANGGVASRADAERLFEATGAAGVMVGQALLADPTLLGGERRTLREFATEYLEIARGFPDINFFCPRKHIFTFFADVIREKPGIEKEIHEAETIDDLLSFVNKYTQ